MMEIPLFNGISVGISLSDTVAVAVNLPETVPATAITVINKNKIINVNTPLILFIDNFLCFVGKIAILKTFNIMTLFT